MGAVIRFPGATGRVIADIAPNEVELYQDIIHQLQLRVHIVQDNGQYTVQDNARDPVSLDDITRMILSVAGAILQQNSAVPSML